MLSKTSVLVTIWGSLLIVAPVRAQPASGWSTYQHDARRTGRTEAVIPAPPVRKWSVPVGYVYVPVSPTIGPDGTIYVARNEDLFVAVNADGSVRWYGDFGAGVFAPATIQSDGDFFLSKHSTLGKVDHTDGSGLCGLPNIDHIAPAMDDDGNLYSSTVKLDPGCSVQWTYGPGVDAVTAVAIGPDGGIYMTVGFLLVKLNPETGDELWSFPTTGEGGAPAIAPDGTVYTYVSPDTLTAVNPDGTEKWALIFADLRVLQPAPSPAIGTDGTIYHSSKQDGDPVLVAVSASGSELWRHVEPIGGGYDGLSPVIDGLGTVLFPVEGGDLVALSAADGSELWRIDVGVEDYVNTSPAIGEDGTVYVTTDGGFLIAFGVLDIPAVTGWGMATLTLLVLTAGSLVLLRHRVVHGYRTRDCHHQSLGRTA